MGSSRLFLTGEIGMEGEEHNFGLPSADVFPFSKSEGLTSMEKSHNSSDHKLIVQC